MGSKQILMVMASVVGALIVSGIGVFCWKTDIFEKLDNPLAKQFPNLSQDFGACVICFAFGAMLLSFFLIAISA